MFSESRVGTPLVLSDVFEVDAVEVLVLDVFEVLAVLDALVDAAAAAAVGLNV